MKNTLVTCLLLTASTISWADRPNWNYVQLTASGGEIEVLGEDIDATSATFSGSAVLTENVAFIGGFSGGEIETSETCSKYGYSCTDIDTAGYEFGIAVHFPATDSLDIVIPVEYIWVELDDGFDTVDDNGYSIGVGFRWMPSSMFELSAGVVRIDIDDESDEIVSASARWHITSMFSLAVGLASADESESASFGARLSF